MLKSKHKERLYVGGAIAGIVTFGIVIYQLHKSKANATATASTLPNNEAVQALATPIPIFSWANYGGSSHAPRGTTSSHLIGNSSPNDTPVGGKISMGSA